MQLDEHRIQVCGIELTYFESGHRDEPTVLLAHATGFHARCWDATVAALGDGVHALALDMRGHGRTDKTGPYEWDQFGADVTAFVDALDLRDVVAVGHSMGGHSVTQAAAHRPDRIRALVLVDPVIMAPQAYANWERDRSFGDATEHPVARRRDRFTSPDDMFERFRDRHPFSLWREDVLRDYCVYGVVPSGDGGFKLGCPPIVEASIYMGSAGRDIGGLIATIEQPVSVMRAAHSEDAREEMDFARSPTWPDLASAFVNGRDVYLPELTHFIPMQRPDLVAEEIRRYL